MFAAVFGVCGGLGTGLLFRGLTTVGNVDAGVAVVDVGLITSAFILSTRLCCLECN